MKSGRICLIRHGETEWSRQGRHTSHSDLPLTTFGEAQARQLGAQLDGVRFDQVWCSPRRRARETCRLAGLDGQAVIDPELREWDYGQYEGLRSIEIRKLVPDWNLFLHGCPGGDSPEQIVSRIDSVIARLRLLHGNSAIVAHGHFLRVLGARWMGLPVTAAEQFQLGTASVSVLGEDGALHLWNHTVDAVTLMLSSA